MNPAAGTHRVCIPAPPVCHFPEDISPIWGILSRQPVKTETDAEDVAKQSLEIINGQNLQEKELGEAAWSESSSRGLGAGQSLERTLQARDLRT